MGCTRTYIILILFIVLSVLLFIGKALQGGDPRPLLEQWMDKDDDERRAAANERARNLFAYKPIIPLPQPPAPPGMKEEDVMIMRDLVAKHLRPTKENIEEEMLNWKRTHPHYNPGEEPLFDIRNPEEVIRKRSLRNARGIYHYDSPVEWWSTRYNVNFPDAAEATEALKQFIAHDTARHDVLITNGYDMNNVSIIREALAGVVKCNAAIQMHPLATHLTVIDSDIPVHITTDTSRIWTCRDTIRDLCVAVLDGSGSVFVAGTNSLFACDKSSNVSVLPLSIGPTDMLLLTGLSSRSSSLGGGGGGGGGDGNDESVQNAIPSSFTIGSAVIHNNLTTQEEVSVELERIISTLSLPFSGLTRATVNDGLIVALSVQTDIPLEDLNMALKTAFDNVSAARPASRHIVSRVARRFQGEKVYRVYLLDTYSDKYLDFNNECEEGVDQPCSSLEPTRHSVTTDDGIEEERHTEVGGEGPYSIDLLLSPYRNGGRTASRSNTTDTDTDISVTTTVDTIDDDDVDRRSPGNEYI